MDTRQVLIVDDARADARLYQAYLSKAGYATDVGHDGAAALSAIETHTPAVVLLDLHLPDMAGLDILHRIKESQPHCHVIMITADEEVRMAVNCMQAGAFDYLTKPIPRDRLLVTVANALNHAKLSDLVHKLALTNERSEYHGMIGASPAMQAVYRTIENAAASRAAAFITGESGTGKELCASALHLAGPRQAKNYVTLNCAALPSELLESELFGHLKGAFTGAGSDRAGAAQRANGGSLFLDEITELDIELQSKLLRFLQTGEIQRLGSNEVERVNVRFICASNRDPWQAVQDHRLREDLYYRLMVIPIELPPLRERREDILPLAHHFLARIAHEEGKDFKNFAPDACILLNEYHWPGNVRQLENGLRRVVVLNQGETVTAAMLKSVLRASQRSSAEHAPKTNTTADAVTPQENAGYLLAQTQVNAASITQLPKHMVANHPIADGNKANTINGAAPKHIDQVRPLQIVEREVIEAVLELCDGNVTHAAELLDINPSTIHRKRKSWR